MDTDRFIGLVQNRAHLASTGEALRAIEATLQQLGRRLAGNEAEDLASQLPPELGHFLREEAGEGERFDAQEYIARVSLLEGVDPPDAAFHVRAVLSVLQEAVSPGEIEDVKAQLPTDWDRLFEAGSEGRLDLPD